MRAGEMDRFIRIEKNTPTRSASGDQVDSWAKFAEVWAKKRDLKTAESLDADRDVAMVQTEFSIYWLEGVTASMRIVYDSATYDIEGVREIGRREGLAVIATARGV